MESGGDAVGEQLRFGFRQREIGGEIDAGARLHLPLERIAVQVDDAGQHQQAVGVERPGIGRRRTVEPDDPAVGEQQIGIVSEPARPAPGRRVI